MSSEKQIFTLKQVAQSIQKLMNERYAQLYWVKAEVFKLNYTNKGHCFPELVHKEDGKIVTEMRGTIWATNYARISKSFGEIVKEPISDGMNLLLLVKISFHPLYGLSLEIQDIDPTFSLGELQKEREESLEKLRKLGLINLNQQLNLALIPKKLAIISVDSSKGYQDFCSVLLKNSPKYIFLYKLFHAQLNGDLAIASIISALQQIEELKEHFDAVLIIRGGGGEIGLSCYNNFELAQAVAQFPLPVLTGIGHSTNNTVVEMIAYQSFITPTELAEYLIQVYKEFELQLAQLSLKIKAETKKTLKEHNTFLKEQMQLFRFASKNNLKENNFKIVFIQQNIKTYVLNKLKGQEVQNLTFIQNQLKRLSFQFINKKNENIEDSKFYILKNYPKLIEVEVEKIIQFTKSVSQLDPQNILKRGYSYILTKDKKTPKSKDLKIGETLEIINFDSVILAEIKKINTKNG